ncbi:MAG: heat-inducible transcriptional repressor HrcA [Dehalococcoidales bacterium]|nr:heat-inducible transcriptional repressor HrcA [Dehalococcoidales bacterium]
MLSPRREKILRAIVEQYVAKARPVPSQEILADREMEVSSATIRNEMMRLEEEGYIIRPHTSAGSVPTDKGYRRYVEAIGDIQLPVAEQRLVSHLFHQVERELEEWLNLAATLLAQMVHNTAVVTTPKAPSCRFKHLELVSLQGSLALLVMVLDGARVRQQLISFDQVMFQEKLTIMATKLNAIFAGLNSTQIRAKDTAGLSLTEQKLTDCLAKIMETEDEREYAEPYLYGLHFMLSQPEFAHDQHLALSLMELIERRSLMRSIIPPEFTGRSVRVIIGRENRAESIHDYSVVISRYGLPQEAAGTIGVIGPTRMPYAHTMATVNYLASVLSRLVARLYGREMSDELYREATN